jgi:uncharacterized protein
MLLDGMTEPSAETDLGSLCLSCGMCCSGVLFPKGSLGSDEIAEAQAAGLIIVPDPSEATSDVAFAQPCQLLDGTACKGYATWRPKVCASYFCKLAGRVRDGRVPLEAAKDRVGAALDLQAQIAPLLEPGETWPAANQRWSSGKLDRTASPASAQLHLLLTALNLHLDHHFRRKGEQTVGKRDAL